MTVQIKYERPDPQRQLWVTAPLFVEIDGEPARVEQWCLEGFKIAEFAGELPSPGQALALRVSLPFQGFTMSFDAQGEVVDPAETDGAHLVVRFLDLSERARGLMSHFFEELLRGSMVPVEDTIQRIDVPVMPMSLAANPTLAGVRTAGPLKSLAMTALYGALGALVFGYLALLLYSNLFRLEVPTAVISSPTEVAHAQGEGRISLVGSKPGDHVKSGDVVVELYDNKLEREIELAEITVREKEAKLAAIRLQYDREKDRLVRLGVIENTTEQQVSASVESLKAQLKIAEQEVKRASGAAIAARFPMAVVQAKRHVLTLQQQIESKELDLKSRSAMAKANAGRRVYVGRSLVGDLGQIESQVSLAEQDVEFAKQRHQSYLNQRANLAVRAPFDGVVTDLPAIDKGSVKRGDVIAVIEQQAAHQVTAYLSQDEILKVGLGDPAVLYVPAIGATAKAKVSGIDRTNSFVRDQGRRADAQTGWRTSADRSATVTLAFNNLSEEAQQQYRSGLPVVVIFEKHTTNGVVGSLRRIFASVTGGGSGQAVASRPVVQQHVAKAP